MATRKLKRGMRWDVTRSGGEQSGPQILHAGKTRSSASDLFPPVRQLATFVGDLRQSLHRAREYLQVFPCDSCATQKLLCVGEKWSRHPSRLQEFLSCLRLFRS